MTNFLPRSIKVISRSKGKSAVAAAAYRTGEKITNQFDRMPHDYTHKGSVVHTEILLPDHTPAEYTDRAFLWNEVEKIKKAKNAQLAQEIEIALPLKKNIFTGRRKYVSITTYFFFVYIGNLLCLTKNQQEVPHF